MSKLMLKPILPWSITFSAFSAFLCLQTFNANLSAQEKVHAISMYDTPKYGPNFTHFDYANPDAPKGGTLKTSSQGSFDSFHPFIPKGNASQTGSVERLMAPSRDEDFSQYGLIAESLEVPDDRSWIIFNLHPMARWHDGVPITADDVVWSFYTLIEKGHPHYRYYYTDIKKAEKLGKRRVRFTFAQTKNRELPLIIGQLPILPKHYWEKRDFEKTTLDPPLGSGPYRVKKFEAGRYIVLERVKDYWGEKLPVNRGMNNFDYMRINFYRDPTSSRLALKSGDIDIFFEGQAKAWALNYNIPAVRNGLLKKELIPDQGPAGMLAFIMNTRRDKFSHRKVRQALSYAFDYEWINKVIFFNQYTRTQSYFSNSKMAATGLPEGKELKILEKYRDRLPPEVFNRPYQVPKTDGKGWPRKNLKEASKLLAQSGYKIENMKLVHQETGEILKFELLLSDGAFKRIALPFVKNLSRLGIDAHIRLVDQSQYMNRIRGRDFDIMVSGWRQSLSPGNEQKSYWGSHSADRPNTSNYAGIKDPIIDELIELLIQAKDRESLVARTRALDRVLLWGHYVIPGWHLAFDRVLSWDKFSRPPGHTKQGVFIDRWWYDQNKAQSLSQKMSAGFSTDKASKDSNKTKTLAMAIGILAIIGMVTYFFRYYRRREIK